MSAGEKFIAGSYYRAIGSILLRFYVAQGH